MTLCDICHDGLEPHEVLSLIQSLGPNALKSNLSKRQKEYREGLRFYREWAERMFSDFEKSDEQAKN